MIRDAIKFEQSMKFENKGFAISLENEANISLDMIVNNDFQVFLTQEISH